jgi:hypothetical protein
MILEIISLLLACQEGRPSVEPADVPSVFSIKYTVNIKWYVERGIFNEKGKRKYPRTIKNATGFIMPFTLDGEV